jgi:tRNA A37 threonylcarbamoyladenosine synthetase subunit TsaC/SUA5/YrdC
MDIAMILETKYAGKQWHLVGNDYEGLTWLETTDKPSKATLESLWPEVQTIIANAKTAKDAKITALLAKLGITADEAALLFN